MEKGRIKLHRQIQDRPERGSEPFTRGQARVDLVLLANHCDGFFYIRGNKVIVKRGQVGRSEQKLSEKRHRSRNKLRRWLKQLETEQQIKQQKSQVLSVITIINYNSYQSDDTTDETTERQQKVQQKNTNKNDKNNKEGKEEDPKGSNIANAQDEKLENPPEEDSDLEEYLPEEKTLPTPNPLPKKMDTDRKEKVLYLLSVFKEACQEAGLQYISGKYETTSIRNLYSDKFQESIKTYNMTTEEFIKNIIKCSVRPYMPDVSSPLKFYQNRGKVINTIRKEKEKIEEEKKRNEATKKKTVRLS